MSDEGFYRYCSAKKKKKNWNAKSYVRKKKRYHYNQFLVIKLFGFFGQTRTNSTKRFFSGIITVTNSAEKSFGRIRPRLAEKSKQLNDYIYKNWIQW